MRCKIQDPPTVSRIKGDDHHERKEELFLHRLWIRLQMWNAGSERRRVLLRAYLHLRPQLPMPRFVRMFEREEVNRS